MNRDVVLFVYGGLLGWYLAKWWAAERQYLIWSAAERAAALSAAKTNAIDPTEAPTAA